MQRKSKKRAHSQRQVRIDFTGKLLTSFGGTASLISRFISKVNFRDFIENHFPIVETSNNSTGIYSKIVSFFITILNGGNRFAHMNLLNSDIEVFQKCFQVERLPKASTSLTRFWNKFNRRSLNEKLLEMGIKFCRSILHQANIKEDSLRFDSTVLTRYGVQEGAKRGYNPTKRGRPSHQPQIAFLGLGFIVNMWNRCGNISSGNGIIDFFDQTVSYLRKINITRILADSGFYLIDFISHLEEKGFEYVISAKIFPILQKKIYGLTNWKKVTDGIEVSEFMFQHISEVWNKDRRYIVIRQEIKKRPKASGKQLNIFSLLGEEPSYRHQLLITNNTKDDPYAIWNYYKPRANDENIIENLKDGFGFDAFNLDNFWATEAVLITICLIFHNLLLYLMKYIVNPEHSRQKLRTFRMKFLIVPGILGNDGRIDVLRLGIGNKTFRNKFKKLLDSIENIKLNFNCNAVQYI